MRQQALTPDHSQGVLGKKSGKAVKGEDFVENGRRSVDGLSLTEEKPGKKMAGGRLKGSATYQNKDSKVIKDHKDRKEEKEGNDRTKQEEDLNIKAPGATEAGDEEGEGRNRRGQDSGTMLQWGQRRRPRYRDSSGLLKTSIRADRRVVRADKQVATQPASQPPSQPAAQAPSQAASQPPSQSRGNFLRPSSVPTQEAASGTGKRTAEAAEVSGTGVTNMDCDYVQLSASHPPAIGDEEEKRQHPTAMGNQEMGPPHSSGGHGGGGTFAHARTDPDSLQGKGAHEKMKSEFFEWPKIEISLTRKEKEDDFAAIKGTKLPQRPKRRPKTVEKNVQFISPGTWLCDLTRERYEVREKKTVKKKPRGLKAMGNVDSDSD